MARGKLFWGRLFWACSGKTVEALQAALSSQLPSLPIFGCQFVWEWRDALTRPQERRPGVRQTLRICVLGTAPADPLHTAFSPAKYNPAPSNRTSELLRRNRVPIFNRRISVQSQACPGGTRSSLPLLEHGERFSVTGLGNWGTPLGSFHFHCMQGSQPSSCAATVYMYHDATRLC